MANEGYLERMKEAKRLIDEAHDLVKADNEHDVGDKLSDALTRINRIIKEEQHNISTGPN
jgi:hypothetical protein